MRHALAFTLFLVLVVASAAPPALRCMGRVCVGGEDEYAAHELLAAGVTHLVDATERGGTCFERLQLRVVDDLSLLSLLDRSTMFIRAALMYRPRSLVFVRCDTGTPHCAAVVLDYVLSTGDYTGYERAAAAVHRLLPCAQLTPAVESMLRMRDVEWRLLRRHAATEARFWGV
jgi:hypothetical protein